MVASRLQLCREVKYLVHHLPNVILPLMNSGGFLVSAMAASGMPQLATGPQKCVLQREKGRDNLISYDF